jgi:hypothetical protein
MESSSTGTQAVFGADREGQLMAKERTDVANRINTLQAEESAIEDRETHVGFRDASRRNRIEEQLDALHEAVRKNNTSHAAAPRPIPAQTPATTSATIPPIIGK